MKIDTMQMKRNKDGTFTGEVTPTRFQFASEKLVYPLKITQISVKEKTEALFYVQAPHKVDLHGDMTLPVHVDADAASGPRLHAGRLARQGQRLAQSHRAEDSRPLAESPGAGIHLRRRPASAAQQQGTHPDDDGMGP